MNDSSNEVIDLQIDTANKASKNTSICLFVVEVFWLICGVVSINLKSYICSLYESDKLPFTVSSVWLCIPFVFIVFTVIGQIHQVFNKKSLHKWFVIFWIFFSFVLAAIYIFMTFLPLNITILASR